MSAIASSARIVGEPNTAVELYRLETGEQEQCLKKIHPNFLKGLRANLLKLDGNLIRAALMVRLQSATEYTIRALRRLASSHEELAVALRLHIDFLSLVSDCPSVAEAGGESIFARQGAL